ncbi:NAD(P)/FAD-dependent oxidoreductase [Pirellulaceae bacterium SH501]
MEHQHRDLLICGGGVIGLSIAYQCAKLGWKVSLLDRGRFGQGASWSGAGILPAGATVEALDPLEQLRGLSHRLHKQWASELWSLTGIDNEYRETGGLYLGRTPAERATLIANEMWWEEHGIEFQRWSFSDAQVQLPSLSQHLPLKNSSDIWWVPGDCRVRNPYHIDALVEANRRLGVELIEGSEIVSFDFSRSELGESRAAVVDRHGNVLQSDRICVASGAWSRQLLGQLGIETGIMPVRGQMVLYKLDAPWFPFVINEGHRYMVPRDDGHLLVGSCEEEVGFNTSTTETMIEELKEWACSLVPDLRHATVKRSWAGLRPGSFDSYPYLGSVPGYQGVYVASGHFRHGLHWSTGTAVLMQQLMAGQKTEIDLEPFRVLRGHNSK